MSNSIENSIKDGLSKISKFQATINVLISHINPSMHNILVFFLNLLSICIIKYE